MHNYVTYYVSYHTATYTTTGFSLKDSNTELFVLEIQVLLPQNN